MAVIDVKLVSGYQADEESLERVSFVLLYTEVICRIYTRGFQGSHYLDHHVSLQRRLTVNDGEIFDFYLWYCSWEGGGVGSNTVSCFCFLP